MSTTPTERPRPRPARRSETAALYLERLIRGGRHVEIQVLADRYGNVVHLGERDCSVQRHHQKLIEESPAPTLSGAVREATLDAAVRATQAIGYVGAGTIELLLGEDGSLRFMEMNTRLQVEHPVTEMRAGVDLVAKQLEVAAGRPLGLTQADIALRGHAIECRINAEDPDDDFRPSPGTISRFGLADLNDPHVRLDTHVAPGYEVPPFYDSLLCKLIVWGETREAATRRMLDALDALECEGVPTTVPLHRAVLQSREWAEGAYDTRHIPGFPRSSEPAEPSAP